MPWFAGRDGGGRSHAVCVIDAAGRVVARLEARHDADGLDDLLGRLERLAPPADLAVALEHPSGLLVDALVEAGHPVVAIPPNVVKACRPRYRAAGGKSDPGDAFRLADVLRTDGHRFRPLTGLSDEIRALRALVRGRDDLVATRVALANQLRALLESFWPGAAAIFAAIASPIALAFVTRYPTPDSAARLGAKRLAAFPAQHACCGRRSPAEPLARPRAAPAGRAAAAEADAKGELVRALAATLERRVAAIARLAARIEHAVADLRDGRIIMAFPRAGRLCAAQILAELGSPDRFLGADQLAAEAGVAPVTHASGKSRGVVFRWAGNHRLRRAVTRLADNSRHASAWAAALHAKARQRGGKHPHAIRILARAWLKVLWRAWQERHAYDPAKHTAAARLAA
jgi:transposase